METSLSLAIRIREVLLNGKWIANTNFKEHIVGLTWELAIKKVNNLNSIAMLTFHINYYVEGVLHVLQGGDLTIKDQYSFDIPKIASEADWQNMIDVFLRNAENLAKEVENLDEKVLISTFVQEKYGTYIRNIEAVIEHSYYHLGQVSLIKKMVLLDSFQ
jgi:hypothetical protein